MFNQTLLTTPLDKEHIKLGARMVPFGGWSMPVQYSGILNEYNQTRSKASIFDTSHMGEFILSGTGATQALENIVTARVEDMPLRSCRYAAMLNEAGGVIDDLIIFRRGNDDYFIVVNGATIEKDYKHISTHLTDTVEIKNISDSIGKIDLQGPRSRDVLSNFVSQIEKLGYYTFDYFDLLGEHVLISRTGYTGELGYEIYFPSEKVAQLWNRLLDHPLVEPAGLGARDMLRLEMGYSLYGHELTDQISPLEAGLKRFVDLDKDFIGKAGLLGRSNNESVRHLVGLVSNTRKSPRHGQKVFNQLGECIGEVTSGTFSPYLQKGVGLALIHKGTCGKGDLVVFGDDEKTKNAACVSGRTFYTNGSYKN